MIEGSLVGKTVGHYKILKKIGQGGMGEVYQAHHEALGRSVALKVLPPHIAGDEEAVQRFFREARSAAKLEHTNIVQVYDMGQKDNLYFIVMQLVEGISLQEYVRQKKFLPPIAAIRVIRQVADALNATHDAGIIHRDVKPSNILLTREGKVKVVDFGLSRNMDAGATISQAGAIVGTPYFISPEQVKGEKADGRSDIYALGMTFYYILTGVYPFEGESTLSIVMRRVEHDAKPIREIKADIPHELAVIVDKMIRRNPQERYQTMREVIEDLDRYLKPPATMMVASSRWGWKKYALIASAVVVLLLALAAILKGGSKKVESPEVAAIRKYYQEHPADYSGVKVKINEYTRKHGKDDDIQRLAAQLQMDLAYAKEKEEGILKKRAKEMWDAFVSEKWDEAIQYLDPEKIKKEGTRNIKNGLRFIIGGAKLFKLELVSVEIGPVEVNLEAGTAQVTVKLNVLDKNTSSPRKKPPEHITKWVRRAGQWYHQD